MNPQYLASADDHTDSIEPPRDLDTAYESLLASREILFTNIPDQSDEDNICNQTLQTSYLFKTLSDKYINLNKQIEELVDNEKSLDEAMSKCKSSHLTMSSLCMMYDSEENRGIINTKYVELAEIYVTSHIKMRKEIILKRAALELQLDALSIKLNTIRNVIKTSIEEIVKPENINKKMCPVCFDKEVCMVMIPCGHTYCDACSKYDYRAKCPQCRATINSRVKMYFSL